MHFGKGIGSSSSSSSSRPIQPAASRGRSCSRRCVDSGCCSAVGLQSTHRSAAAAAAEVQCTLCPVLHSPATAPSLPPLAAHCTQLHLTGCTLQLHTRLSNAEKGWHTLKRCCNTQQRGKVLQLPCILRTFPLYCSSLQQCLYVLLRLVYLICIAPFLSSRRFLQSCQTARSGCPRCIVIYTTPCSTYRILECYIWLYTKHTPPTEALYVHFNFQTFNVVDFNVVDHLCSSSIILDFSCTDADTAIGYDFPGVFCNALSLHCI